MLTHVHSLQRTQSQALRNKPVIRFHAGAESQREKIRNILRGPVVQPQLKIGAPNDKYEQEADRVAEQVMQMPAPQLTSSGVTPNLEETQPEPEEEVIPTQPITPLIQRQETLEDKEENEELIQTKTAGDVIPEVTPAISVGIRSLQGGGRPLSKSERGFFEPRFGRYFSEVRVHNDARAANLARSIHSRAFTFGRDIVLGAGEHSPNTLAGKKLLAHELTHVVQQNGGSTFRELGIYPKELNNNQLVMRLPFSSPQLKREQLVQPQQKHEPSNRDLEYQKMTDDADRDWIGFRRRMLKMLQRHYSAKTVLGRRGLPDLMKTEPWQDMRLPPKERVKSRYTMLLDVLRDAGVPGGLFPMMLAIAERESTVTFNVQHPTSSGAAGWFQTKSNEVWDVMYRLHKGIMRPRYAGKNELNSMMRKGQLPDLRKYLHISKANHDIKKAIKLAALNSGNPKLAVMLFLVHVHGVIQDIRYGTHVKNGRRIGVTQQHWAHWVRPVGAKTAAEVIARRAGIMYMGYSKSRGAAQNMIRQRGQIPSNKYYSNAKKIEKRILEIIRRYHQTP